MSLHFQYWHFLSLLVTEVYLRCPKLSGWQNNLRCSALRPPAPFCWRPEPERCSLTQLVLNLCVVGRSLCERIRRSLQFYCKQSKLKIYAHVHLVCQHCTKTPVRASCDFENSLSYIFTIQTDNMEVLIYHSHLFWRNFSWCIANMKYLHFQSNSCP